MSIPNDTANAVDTITLVRQAKAQLPNDSRAFEALVEPYVLTLQKFCTNFLRSESAAQDCTQEILIKAFHGLKSFEEKASFKTWIFRIAHNHCVDTYRKIMREKDYFSDIADDAIPDIAEEQSSEPEANIHDVLALLEASDREILLLRYVEGHSIEEVQTIMNLGKSAVKMRCARAIERVRELIREGSNLITLSSIPLLMCIFSDAFDATFI